MNKRIRKKRKKMKIEQESKNLKIFARQLKKLCQQTTFTYVPSTPSFEQECHRIETAYKQFYSSTQYEVENIKCSSKINDVIEGTITLVPRYFPIDIQIQHLGKK